MIPEVVNTGNILHLFFIKTRLMWSAYHFLIMTQRYRRLYGERIHATLHIKHIWCQRINSLQVYVQNTHTLFPISHDDKSLLVYICHLDLICNRFISPAYGSWAYKSFFSNCTCLTVDATYVSIISLIYVFMPPYISRKIIWKVGLPIY